MLDPSPDPVSAALLAARLPATNGVLLGVYEKALVWRGDWDHLFAQAAHAGYAFVDLSIDESDERQARLDWSPEERAAVRAASARSGVAIGGVCLSAHRAVGPGSAHPAVRLRALDMLLRTVDLCVDLGADLIQLAGYFAYYEPADAGAGDRYFAVIEAGARYAARRGVMLGIENVDGDDLTSISRAVEMCEAIGSAYVQLYPDIGNLTEQRLDVRSELAKGRGRMLALHVKDTRPGEPRRVGMGEGDVPWDDAFAELARQRWSGRIMVEMWNDDRQDSVAIATEAREYIEQRLRTAGIRVIHPDRPRRGPTLRASETTTNEMA